MNHGDRGLSFASRRVTVFSPAITFAASSGRKFTKPPETGRCAAKRSPLASLVGLQRVELAAQRLNLGRRLGLPLTLKRALAHLDDLTDRGKLALPRLVLVLALLHHGCARLMRQLKPLADERDELIPVVPGNVIGGHLLAPGLSKDSHHPPSWG